MDESRREFLRGASSMGAIGFGLGRLPAGVLRGWIAPEPQANLVLLQLSGGNDGLSTVVPYADDNYARARPTLRRTREEVHPLDDYRGLHSDAKGLIEAWEDGELAIVEGAGYPRPNRSHFKSMEIWQTADRRGRRVGEGWIGKLADAAFGSRSEVTRIVHLGDTEPYSLHSRSHPATSFEVPESYRWIGGEDAIGAFGTEASESPEQASGSLGALRRMLDSARASSLTIRSAAEAYRPRTSYPDSDLGRGLRTAAALLAGGIGTRIVSMTMGGFDTHTDSRARHDRQMVELGDALSAFRVDLAGTEQGARTVLLAFSEFGRRVAENASRGTDHGTAGPMFVMGEPVRGGLFGRHPSLSELEDGDLVFTTDFRAVYAELGTLFGAPRDFLGTGQDKLGIVNSKLQMDH